MVLQRTEKKNEKKEVPEFNFSRPISIQNVVKFWVAIGLIGAELQGIRSVKKKVKSRQCDIKEKVSGVTSGHQATRWTRNIGQQCAKKE